MNNENKKPIRLVSLFSGIGAFEKALKKLETDYELVNFCENDKYAEKSYCLLNNVTPEKNLKDVNTCSLKEVKNIDLITYGFPCQDISMDGRMRGVPGRKRQYHSFRIILPCC